MLFNFRDNSENIGIYRATYRDYI